jgi:hypothetical protein
LVLLFFACCQIWGIPSCIHNNNARLFLKNTCANFKASTTHRIIFAETHTMWRITVLDISIVLGRYGFVFVV